jgi:hypothetical protein
MISGPSYPTKVGCGNLHKLVPGNAVVLTDATERPTTPRHNFVSREHYVFMTPLVSRTCRSWR